MVESPIIMKRKHYPDPLAEASVREQVDTQTCELWVESRIECSVCV